MFEEEALLTCNTELNQEFKAIRDELYELFDVCVLNSESKVTTKKKQLFEARYFDVLILNKLAKRQNEPEINMKGSFHVSNNCENLQTNASIKILIKNSTDLLNDFPEAGEDNMYVVRNWSEALGLLKFFNSNREFIEDIQCE